MSATATEAPRAGARVHVQRFGTFLSNMVMPNIPALIAWGLFTALFIDVGWVPNEALATMVGPAIHFLLPILIAATGGRIVYGDRGAVVGAFATMGVMAGSDYLIANFNAAALADWLAAGNAEADFKSLGQVHMFIGAMIMGPAAAWVMKKLDSMWEGKIPSGFEMLVNMFSAGLTAFVMSIVGFFALARIVNGVMDVLSSGVNWLIDTGFLPLVSILIEPAKVFFLNNAINHGVLTPLGLSEAAEKGKSVLFLLEANPGPGLGLLLAYSIFGTGIARATAPGAAVIHFIGGIHEVYFPYVLMKPKLILAMIAGGATGVAINVGFGVGLRTPAAPGSIMAVYANTAAGSFLGVTLAVLGSAAVTFAVAALLLKTDKSEDEGDLAAATASMESMKGKKSSVASALTGSHTGRINSIVFACDAGMGSSAMGASVLRKKIAEAGFGDVTVVNKAIANLSDTFDLVVSHQDLTPRARQNTPSAIHVSVDNFMGSPRYDEIVEMLHQTNDAGTTAGTVQGTDESVIVPGRRVAGDILTPSSIQLSGTATTKQDAIIEAGRLLVESGAVDASYIDSMLERETSVSTHMGNGLAIPHGTNEAKSAINRSAISFVRPRTPVDWNGKPAEFVIGIAGAGDDHIKLLSRIAEVFTKSEEVERLRQAESAEEVLEILRVHQ